MSMQANKTFSLFPLLISAVFFLQGGMLVSAQEPFNTLQPEAPIENDPWLWLEDVEGEKSLDWVRQRNALAQEKLENAEGFKQLNEDLLSILDSDARIPGISKRGDYFYNFWRDKANPRGLWRRTTLEEYRKELPEWEILLDLDQLAEQEGENWVWKGSNLLRPNYNLALITLSRGGADAGIVREFDLTAKAFVPDGFQLPESKGSMNWIDQDHVFVQTNFGEGTMTSSGYPRIAKRWKRGTNLSDAQVIYEGLEDDMAVTAYHDDSPGYERNFVVRSLAFYNNELFFLDDQGSLSKVEVPNSASKSVFHQYLSIELREPWAVAGKTYEAGSLLIADFEEFMAGNRDLKVVFEPSENTALSSAEFTKDYLVLNVLEDVKNRLYVIDLKSDDWSLKPLVGAPEFGTVRLSANDADESNQYFMTTTDYLTPTTLSIGEVGHKPEKLKSLPEFFDASELEISQHFATSDDGTRVPYFMVASKKLQFDSSNPTLLYGYGGFEISLQPSYNGSVGRAWTSQGGVYVVANIRGGGEYGPRWHRAALKENRLRAYEDFAAVAKDLIQRRVTSPKRLGIQGGSNGGLLVGNMVAIYPELMNAAVCQVPLLDMRRYNRLLAGASWMAEYGNPDIDAEWAFIQKFSPYHNISENKNYPAVLFTTSTRDDRVHPGHARKMMALMESQGHNVLYYENIEGGHGGAANNKQAAYMQALAYTFLKSMLMASDN